MTTHSRSRGAERREPPPPIRAGQAPSRHSYRSRELRVAPSRELRTVSFCIDVIVLAPARTVKGLSLRGSSRSRSNSKEATVVIFYRSRCNRRELLNVDIETDPGSSRSRSNSKGCRLVVSYLLSLQQISRLYNSCLLGLG